MLHSLPSSQDWDPSHALLVTSIWPVLSWWTNRVTPDCFYSQYTQVLRIFRSLFSRFHCWRSASKATPCSLKCLSLVLRHYGKWQVRPRGTGGIMKFSSSQEKIWKLTGGCSINSATCSFHFCLSCWLTGFQVRILGTVYTISLQWFA